MKKRKFLLAWISALAVTVTFSSLGADQESKRDIYYHPHFSTPYWISVSRAVDSSGVVDKALLGVDLAESIETLIYRGGAEKSEGCNEMTYELGHMRKKGRPIKPKPENFDEALKNAQTVLVGTLTNVEYGFDNSGRASALWETVVNQSIKGNQRLVGASLFLVGRSGEFEVGGRKICFSTTGFELERAPVAGDRVLLALPEHRLSVGDYVFLPSGREFVLLKQSGAISFSSKYTKQTERSKSLGQEKFIEQAQRKIEEIVR